MKLRALALTLLILSGVASAASAQALRGSQPITPSSAPDSITERVTAGNFSSASAAIAPPTTKYKEGRRADYEAMVAVHAKANGVPEALVHRIIVRESKYQTNLIGRGGTIGMMQIKLPTARGMGFTGTADELLDPQTNLHWGVKYLAGAWRAAHGDADLAVRKYAAGYYERRGRNTASR